jgi:transposase-like protein
MDETYIKVKGKWVYLYRAVDSHGDTLDFMLSERRDEDAATAFASKQLTIMAVIRAVFYFLKIWYNVVKPYSLPIKFNLGGIFTLNDEFTHY